MKLTDYAEIAQIIKTQEEILRFPRFTNEDALKLGNFLAERVKEQGIDLAISIRKLNGSIIFQYLTENTNGVNEKWLKRKFNITALMEVSSLRAWAMNEGDVMGLLNKLCLDSENYYPVGGAFPIRLVSGEILGAVIVSNMPHANDHRFLTNALADYLGKEIPDLIFE